jgi:hypothetical protein
MIRILALVLLVACGDNFSSIQQADTPTADKAEVIKLYEDYLTNNPDGRWVLQANDRLETLYLEKAAAEKSLEAYDAYLARFPEGKLRGRALGEREGFLFDWAKSENTKESWNKFLDEYPKAEKKLRSEARRMVEVHEYLDKVSVSEPRVKQVNMAENPDGPLDGWGFEVDVVNHGDEVIEDMRLTIHYLTAEGGSLDSKQWPVVAPTFPVPIEEEKKVPIQPGETRVWWWTDSGMPTGWAEGKVRIEVTKLQRAGAKE